ncbi:MAG: hypothetical protein KTR18_15405 [Acidiferrobacterales bacterium]|nr:hypothetical protein [Acidiferrobacterales bacterium]
MTITSVEDCNGESSFGDFLASITMGFQRIHKISTLCFRMGWQSEADFKMMALSGLLSNVLTLRTIASTV